MLGLGESHEKGTNPVSKVFICWSLSDTLSLACPILCSHPLFPNPKGNLSLVSYCLIPNGVFDDKGLGDLAVLSGYTLIGIISLLEMIHSNGGIPPPCQTMAEMLSVWGLPGASAGKPLRWQAALPLPRTNLPSSNWKISVLGSCWDHTSEFSVNSERLSHLWNNRKNILGDLGVLPPGSLTVKRQLHLSKRAWRQGNQLGDHGLIQARSDGGLNKGIAVDIESRDKLEN